MECVKVSHRTYNEALKVSQQIEKRNGRNKRIYKCKNCGNWHLTSQRKVR